MFRITRAHVYLTVPFVLSWSMLEAMASGALVVGSDTPPVKELITDGEVGVLTDFFDPARIAASIEAVLSGDVDSERLTQAARRTIVEQYALQVILPRQWNMMTAVANGEQPVL
jgi:glycosyltransferase involved in cell wall biosynthesis